MPGDAIAVTLPSGLWLDGRYVRHVALRALGPTDGPFLAETATEPVVARRASSVIARCLVTDPGLPEPEVMAGRLTAGDREAVLLHLRRVTFGDEMVATLRCEDPACAEVFEIALLASALLLPPYRRPRLEYGVTVDDDGPWKIRFRLPTGDDQEAAAPIAAVDAGAGAALILRRCVTRVTSPGGARPDGAGGAPDAPPADALPMAAPDVVAAAMAAHDPQAEIELDLVCPACGRRTTALFDAATFLLRELDRSVERLFAEVHLLASVYHWSESAILALSPMRRTRYLQLIAGANGWQA